MEELIKSSDFEKMILDIETLVNASKTELATSINKLMTATYWSIENILLNLSRMAMQKHSMEKICFLQYRKN